MRYLLDTHVLLWISAEPERIPARVIEVIEEPSNTALVSVASIWEAAIKIGKGKLKFSVDDLLAELKQQPFDILPIEIRHVQGLRGLPPIHKDPFDRILISQAIIDDLLLVSVDSHFHNYGVKVFW